MSIESIHELHSIILMCTLAVTKLYSCCFKKFIVLSLELVYEMPLKNCTLLSFVLLDYIKSRISRNWQTGYMHLNSLRVISLPCKTSWEYHYVQQAMS